MAELPIIPCVYRGYNNANANGGVAYANANNDASNANANVGSRLENLLLSIGVHQRDVSLNEEPKGASHSKSVWSESLLPYQTES